MKKILLSPLLLSLLVGCASYYPMGIVYTSGNYNNGNVAVDATNITGSRISRVGKACATSVLGLVAWGDNSVATAKDKGGLSKVNDIDYEVDNLLGIYGKYCTIVRGQ